jgi:uncharacterized protein (TIGR02466 family)
MFRSLFPVKIYHSRLNNLNQLLEQILPELKEQLILKDAKHVDLGVGTVSTFNIDNRLHEHPFLASTVHELHSMIDHCWTEFNYYPGLTPFINEMWLNETVPGGISVNSHNHSPYPLVGVMYLQVEPDMGNIVFENPNDLVVGTQPHNWSGTNDINGGIQETVKIETGDVIIFPGWLKHRGEINNSNMNRYAMSFNIGCSGDYPVSTYLRKNI